MSEVIVIGFLVDLSLLATFWWLPTMRREEAFFGVRVSPETYDGQGREVLSRFRFWLVLSFAQIEALAIAAALFSNGFASANLVSGLLLTAAWIPLYAWAYRRMKPFEVVTAGGRFASSLTTRRLGDFTNLGLEFAVLASIILPALALAYFYPLLPERIPVHWNWRGLPDGWARKSLATVFLLPAMHAYLQGLFLLLKKDLLQAKMTLPGEHAETFLRLKEKSLLFQVALMDRMRLCMAGLLGVLSVNLILTSVPDYRFLAPFAAVLLAVFGFGMMATAFYYIWRIVGTERELKAKVGRVIVQRPTEAAHWYGGGFFYCNPEDPALFVEKLVGIGYTINFGNKRAYVYLVYLAVLPALLAWAFTATKPMP